MTGAQRPGRLVAEESLLETELGRTLTQTIPCVETRPQISPVDYPDFEPDDLLLARHFGSFIKKCPGTRDYICCDLEIIHFGLGCYLDCSYCILQSYLDTSSLVLFGNVDEAFEELEDLLSRPATRRKRFCTGEFTDSLLLEEMTGLGARLVKLFSKSRDRVLELKTKTVNIDGLLELDHGGRTIISFSVNAPDVARNEESRAVPLKKRIEAAGRAVENGYRVGFHFDPLIIHENWQDGYRQTVEDIYKVVPPDKIAWISLGAFRYLPGLKPIIRKRHPKSHITDEEFILAPDGKMRYLRPIRVEMYKLLLNAIRKCDPDACVYMCMESPRVWLEVFGFDPGPEGLVDMLDKRV